MTIIVTATVPVSIEEDASALVRVGCVIEDRTARHIEAASITNENTATCIRGVILYSARFEFKSRKTCTVSVTAHKNSAANFAPIGAQIAYLCCSSTASDGGTIDGQLCPAIIFSLNNNDGALAFVTIAFDSSFALNSEFGTIGYLDVAFERYALVDSERILFVLLIKN